MKIGIAALSAFLVAAPAIAGQPPTGPQTPAQPASSSLPAMQPWTDPVEHAFTLQVPAGWQISGGTHRNAPIDARNPVVAQSPDGRITIFIDDPAILPRQAPHPAYAQMGWTEGRTVQGPAGPLKIERFQTGAQFAEFYSAVKCQGAKKEASFDLKAESQMLSTSIAPMATQMGGNAEVSAGEIYYRCGPKTGYTKSVTVLAYKPGNGPRNWAVYKLAGYVADPGSIDVARTVMNIMVATMKLDPNWEAALQRQINDTTGASWR